MRKMRREGLVATAYSFVVPSKTAESKLHPLLRGLKPEWLAAIGDCSVQAHFRPGEFIFEAGESATRLHLLQSGHVGLEVEMDGHPSQVAIMGPGDLLACPAICEQRHWQISARTFDRVSAQSILVKRLRRLCETDRELACEFSHRIISTLSDQLDAARRQIADVSRLALNSQRMALETFSRVDFSANQHL